MDSTDLFLILQIRFRYRPSAIFRAGILSTRINIKVGESYVQSVKGNTGAKVGTVGGCSDLSIRRMPSSVLPCTTHSMVASHAAYSTCTEQCTLLTCLHGPATLLKGQTQTKSVLPESSKVAHGAHAGINALSQCDKNTP